jgi:hypothetical protein
MKKTFNRRVLLRGLGGAVVAAPFLPTVNEMEAKAQGMAPAAASKRLIVFFTHYGCVTNRWFPKLSHGPLSKADYEAMITLKPMAPYAEKLLMVRGMRTMNEWSFNGTIGQKNDPHTQVCSSHFTCYPVTPNATESSASNAGKFDCKPTGRSIDHIAAEQVNPKGSGTKGGAPLFLQIGGVSGSASNTQTVISWEQPGTLFAGYGTPMQVYTQLTGLFGTGSMMTANPDTYKVARGKSVIDCVRGDLNRLKGVNMGKQDQQKLQDWIDLLHYTGGAAVAAAAQCNKESAAMLPLNDTNVKAGGSIDVVAPIMQDLAVLTAICDSNRVIFMKMPGTTVYKNLGLSTDSHGLSHRIGTALMGGTCLSGVMDMIAKIDLYYAQLFARLVGQLDKWKEADGKTILDNSATVWTQEMSDGNSHNLNNTPILQAGSCGGYFKTGWTVNVEKASTTLSQGNSDGDCKNNMSPFGSLDSVGTPAGESTMPINKYYCNLLNAIGVKGDAMGVPTLGGTGVVKRVGKYDDSKMFSDGGTKPSAFVNEGEYPELRAGAT